MMEIIEFIFGSFWRWLGAFFMISAIFTGFRGMRKSIFTLKIKK